MRTIGAIVVALLLLAASPAASQDGGGKKKLTRKQRDELLVDKLKLVANAQKNGTDTTKLPADAIPQVRSGPRGGAGRPAGALTPRHIHLAVGRTAARARTTRHLPHIPLQSDVVAEAPAAPLWAGYGDLSSKGACEEDLARHCRGVDPGEGRLEDCLSGRLEEEEAGDAKGALPMSRGPRGRLCCELQHRAAATAHAASRLHAPRCRPPRVQSLPQGAGSVQGG